MITAEEREQLDRVRAADGDFYAEVLTLALFRWQQQFDAALEGRVPLLVANTTIADIVVTAYRDITTRIYDHL